MAFDFACLSNAGPRARNEDSAAVFVLPNAAVAACVADGVGGQAGGNLASAEAVRFFEEQLSSDPACEMGRILEQAHQRIWEMGEASAELKGLATTFTGCRIIHYELQGVNVGDSRLHILRGNGIKQLTVDQTEVARLLREGKLPKEDAADYPRRNILESAIGAQRLKIDKIDFLLRPGDRVLLTTDGVHNSITKRELRDFSLKYRSAIDFAKKVEEVVDSRGPRDNFTLVNIVVG